jgi:pimeloyl-ACP methyl ester carboxylesterase
LLWKAGKFCRIRRGYSSGAIAIRAGRRLWRVGLPPFLRAERQQAGRRIVEVAHETADARYSAKIGHVAAIMGWEAGMRSEVETGAGEVKGEEHWTQKGDIRLFLWEKYAGSPGGKTGTILFVHGSSMASTPTFDLHVPGRPDSSVMEWFAKRGYDTWCVDMEGYGRSDKSRDITCDIANGADDLDAASRYIMETRGSGPLLVYGISSGALRAAMFAERHPERVKRLALDAFVWTGLGSPTLAERARKLPEFLQSKRRPIDKAFVNSIFTRDHSGCADQATIDAFADAICALDTSRFRENQPSQNKLIQEIFQ